MVASLNDVVKKEHVVVVDRESYLNNVATTIRKIDEASEMFIQAIGMITDNPEIEGPFRDALSRMIEAYKAGLQGKFESPASNIVSTITGAEEAIIDIDNNRIK